MESIIATLWEENGDPIIHDVVDAYRQARMDAIKAEGEMITNLNERARMIRNDSEVRW